MSRDTHQACLEACNTCAAACHHCAAACLDEPDVKMMAGCIALDMDCAALCQAAAGCLARGSDFAPALCGVCAQVCEACGNECGRHAMEHCQRCAEACRQCAEACRQMAA